MQTNLPHAPVSWIVVQKQAHDIVLSTYGRGLYIMDDITPLEQGMMEAEADGGGRALVAPRPAYRIVTRRGARAIQLLARRSRPSRRSSSRFRIPKASRCAS